MARTTKSDILIPEIFTDAVQGEFAQGNVFKGSALVAMGAAVVDGSFGGGADDIGNEVEIPYFGTLGEFEENVADGTAATPKKIQQTGEKATVVRDTLAFEVTRWGRNAKGGDAYVEAARQVGGATQRAMDRRLITAAIATGGLVRSVFSATSPQKLDYDVAVDAKMLWGDEGSDFVGLAVHSKTMADLFKMRDAAGNPLLTTPQDGSLPRLLGMPICVSDNAQLVAGSTMGSVTETGTTPPDIAVTGNTPLGAWDLKIKVHTAGARGTAKIQFSLDGGQNYSDPILTAASIDLIDPAVDSLVGVNGKSGLTISYENASANADNVWTAKAIMKARSLMLTRSCLAFWFNQAALGIQLDKDILVDSQVGAVHLYAAAKRYRRRPGKTKPGVVVIEHNVGGYV